MTDRSDRERPDTPYKTKLIEVAIPLEDINKESAREKSIRYGHPSTLHLWWARRPLAACRAILFAQLVDDPSTHSEEFPTEEAQNAERERLFGIIRRLVKWDNIHDEGLLAEARAEIWKSCNGNPPPILDPFAGGGSIPLEAQRLGLEAYASDLNPVAALINKGLVEIPPKWAGHPPVFPGAATSANTWPGATGLAEDVRRYGEWMRDEAEKRIGHRYPKAKLPDGTEATVIAWIWARTVTCPNPACAGCMPLARSFWLGKKRNRERFIEPIPDGKRVRFEIRGPLGVPRTGTVGRTGAVCLLCGTPVSLAYIRAEGKAGRMGAQLMAVAAEGTRQRYYLPPSDKHEKAADVDRPDNVPDAEIPHNPRYLTAPNYGMRTWADLFTNRQLVALSTFSHMIPEAREKVLADGVEPPYADAISVYLSFALSKIADNSSSLCTWMYQPSKEGTAHTFGRAALPMVWDFAEGNPFRPGPCDYGESCVWIGRALVELPRSFAAAASAKALDASGLDYRNSLVATDPPYYDNVPYADLSDFFYIWLRRSLRNVLPELFGTVLTPKTEELVADPVRQGGREESERFFLDGFSRVFARIRKSSVESHPISVFYGFKQSESDESGHASTGWETLLEAMITSNWQVTATWPMRTERTGRVREIGSNALASSIVLACRPREETAGVADRRGLIAALRGELPGALRKLQQGSIAPVDLQQAAIGPGMAVFSRYTRVNEPDGQVMRVRTALILINQVLDEVLSEQEGDFGKDTRWCVEWFKSYGFDDGPFGIAETLSKAKNTAVDGLERAGVLRSRAGKVRLASVQDIARNYDPADDDRVSEWEIALHLAKRLHEQGGEPAATLMAAASDKVNLDAVKELAYLLFSIAAKKGWTETAQLFNGLGTSWSDLAGAASNPAMTGPAQAQGQLDLGTDDE